MDLRAREHLGFTLTHEVDLQLRAFDRALDAHYGDCAKAGRFHSGYRIIGAIGLMAETMAAFQLIAIEKARSLSRGWDSFEIAELTARGLFAIFEKRLPSIVWHPDGVGQQNDQAVMAAAKQKMTQIASDLTSAMKIAEFDFEPPDGATDPVSDVGMIAPVTSGLPVPMSLPNDSPRLPEAALSQWWNNFGNRRDELSIVALVNDARRSHPMHQISRERIRALAAGRKPGPKPIGGNRPA